MAFTALNAPYSNGSTQFFELPHHVSPPHPDTHFRTERRVSDLNSNHPLYHDSRQNKQNTLVLDNVVTDRPTGVTTTAFSPFPESGEGRSYMSNGENETETESDRDEILIKHHKFGAPATLPESPLLHHQVTQLTSSDPLETSLESHSGHSSASQLQYDMKPYQRQPQGHTVNQNSQYFHFQYVQDVPETNGRFTSLSATPDSQQKESVVDQTRQESDSGEAEGELCEREGPLELEEDLRKSDERKPVGLLLGSDHIRSKTNEQAKDENSGRKLSASHTKEGYPIVTDDVEANGGDKSEHPLM